MDHHKYSFLLKKSIENRVFLFFKKIQYIRIHVVPLKTDVLFSQLQIYPLGCNSEFTQVPLLPQRKSLQTGCPIKKNIFQQYLVDEYLHKHC
jgi:hypothetical protein